MHERRKDVPLHFDPVPQQRARHRGVDPPEGWVQVRVTRGAKSEIMWRCPYITRDLQGFWRRCSYVCGKAHTHSHHTHEYLIHPSEDPDLSSDYRTLNHEGDGSLMCDVMQALGSLAGEQAISASALCSPSMRKFIVRIAQITAQYRERNKRNVFQPEKLVAQLSRNELQKSILRAGNSVYIFWRSKWRTTSTSTS